MSNYWLDRLHYVHFLLRTTQNRKPIWVAPVEISWNGGLGGSFAVPVDDRRQLFDHYRIDIATISKGEPIDISRHTLEREPDHKLKLVVENQVIFFRIRSIPGRRQAIPYGGKLSHPDFSLRLIEIETEGEDDIDLLYEKHRMALVGCLPFSHYSGIQETPTVAIPPPSR
jgi:hypothetical protein